MARRFRLDEEWHLHGAAAADFSAHIDRSVHKDGDASVRLSSNVDAPRGFAELVQSICTDDLRGKRLRVSGWIRGEKGDSEATFRASTFSPNAPEYSPALTEASCDKKGTEWTHCEVVILGRRELGRLVRCIGVIGASEKSATPKPLDHAPVNSLHERRELGWCRRRCCLEAKPLPVVNIHTVEA